MRKGILDWEGLPIWRPGVIFWNKKKLKKILTTLINEFFVHERPLLAEFKKITPCFYTEERSFFFLTSDMLLSILMCSVCGIFGKKITLKISYWGLTRHLYFNPRKLNLKTPVKMFSRKFFQIYQIQHKQICIEHMLCFFFKIWPLGVTHHQKLNN